MKEDYDYNLYFCKGNYDYSSDYSFLLNSRLLLNPDNDYKFSV